MRSNIQTSNFWRVGLMSIGLFWFGALVSRADTYYVATDGAGNGTTWALATNSIQGAISLCAASDTVLVSNGVYQTGGVTNYPAGTVLTNRVVIDKAITVRSANNDPTNTIIKGAWNSSTTNGLDAVRCVYMAAGSSLIGFTLTNGATWRYTGDTMDNNHNGGGVYCVSTAAMISNCVIAGNSANNQGGGIYRGTLFNCTLIGNSIAWYGAGAYDSIMSNCTLIGNSSDNNGGGVYRSGGAEYKGVLYGCTLTRNFSRWGGGGTRSAYLYDCTLISNSSPGGGGGAAGGILSNCTLIGNSGPGGAGGGVSDCTLYNCALISNTVTSAGGGGASGGTLYNCRLIGNSGTFAGGARVAVLYNCLLIGNSSGSSAGGGTYNSSLYNCTVVSNSAGTEGGGVYGGTNVNCIVYYNSAAQSNSNWTLTTIFTNSCTTPAKGGWSVGNITNDPMFVNTNTATANYRLSANSPCINTGLNQDWMTNAVDMDGKIRIRYRTVDMGAFETIYKGTVFTVF